MSDTMKALEVAISENPEDVVPQMALNDLLQDNGKSPLAAKRYVNKVVRTSTSTLRMFVAIERVTEVSYRRGGLRDLILRLAGVEDSYTPIIVRPGKAPPHLVGKPDYFRVKDETKGLREYVNSTERVIVGCDWVKKNTSHWESDEEDMIDTSKPELYRVKPHKYCLALVEEGVVSWEKLAKILMREVNTSVLRILLEENELSPDHFADSHAGG